LFQLRHFNKPVMLLHVNGILARLTKYSTKRHTRRRMGKHHKQTSTFKWEDDEQF
jgi:hypothetical protein